MAKAVDPAKPMTTRQVKYQFKKRGQQFSEDEKRKLERAHERDLRAESLKQQEERRKLAKKKREEKERKEREIRRQQGLGLATQMAGYNHTQLKTKSVMESWLGVKKVKEEEKKSEIEMKLEAEQQELDRELWDVSEDEFEMVDVQDPVLEVKPEIPAEDKKEIQQRTKLEPVPQEPDRELWDDSEEEFEFVDAVQNPLPAVKPETAKEEQKPAAKMHQVSFKSDQWDEEGLDDETLAQLSDQVFSDADEEVPRSPTPNAKEKSPSPTPGRPRENSSNDIKAHLRTSQQHKSTPLCSWSSTPERKSSSPLRGPLDSSEPQFEEKSQAKAAPLFKIASAKPENPEFTRIHGPLNQTVEKSLEALPEDLVELLSVDQSTNQIWRPAATLLHRLSPPWLPPHRLRLKVGCTVQTVQDVYSDKHLLPGYHLRIVKIAKDNLSCIILSGPQAGQTVKVPQASFPGTYQNDQQKTYKRVQFPVKVCPHNNSSVKGSGVGSVPQTTVSNEPKDRSDVAKETNLKRRSSSPESELPAAKRKAPTPTSARTPPRHLQPQKSASPEQSFLQPQKSASPEPRPTVKLAASKARSSNSPQPEVPVQKMANPASQRPHQAKAHGSQTSDTVQPESPATKRAVQMLKLKGQFKVPTLPASSSLQREVFASKSGSQSSTAGGQVDTPYATAHNRSQRGSCSTKVTAPVQKPPINVPQQKKPVKALSTTTASPKAPVASDCWDDFDFLESSSQIARELSGEPEAGTKSPKPIKRIFTQDVDLTMGDMNDLPQSTPKSVASKQVTAVKTNSHSGRKTRALDGVLIETTTYHPAHHNTPSRTPRHIPSPAVPRPYNQPNHLKRKSDGEVMPPPPAKRLSPERDNQQARQVPKPHAGRQQFQPPKQPIQQYRRGSMGPPPLPITTNDRPSPHTVAPRQPAAKTTYRAPQPRISAPAPAPVSFSEFGISTQDVMSMLDDDDLDDLDDGGPSKRNRTGPK